MSDLKCEIQNEAGGELTVGRVFYIICDGDVPSLEPHAELRLDPGNEYKLKVLSLEAKGQLKLKVTSYVPGDHQLKALQLVDANHSVVLGDLNFTVKSVINPQEPPPEKPFGPMGPIEFGMPIWYWVLWATAILTILISLFARFRSLRLKKNQVLELEKQLQGQTPYHYFRGVVRRMTRTHLFLTDERMTADPKQIVELIFEMENAYRVFLGTQFQLPALNWKDNKIATTVTKDLSGETQKKMHSAVLANLKEFSQAKLESKRAVVTQDAIQIFNQMKSNVDELYELVSSTEKKRSP